MADGLGGTPLKIHCWNSAPQQKLRENQRKTPDPGAMGRGFIKAFVTLTKPGIVRLGQQGETRLYFRLDD